MVYHLTPPASICGSVNCFWSISLPWTFTLSAGQGIGPNYRDLLFDQSGNLYGATQSDETNSSGAVYKLTRSGNTWTYKRTASIRR